MSLEYRWAKNPLKLQRAIAKAGKDATEDEVKTLYVSYGGLLDSSYEPKVPMVEEIKQIPQPEGVSTEEAEQEKPEEVIKEPKKKAGRPKKNA